jgi:hypothetical protein
MLYTERGKGYRRKNIKKGDVYGWYGVRGPTLAGAWPGVKEHASVPQTG